MFSWRALTYPSGLDAFFIRQVVAILGRAMAAVLFPIGALAADGAAACYCELDPTLFQKYALADQVAGIGLRALDQSGGAFDAQERRFAWMRLKLKALPGMEKHCLDHATNQTFPRVSGLAQGSYNSYQNRMTAISMEYAKAYKAIFDAQIGLELSALCPSPSNYIGPAGAAKCAKEHIAEAGLAAVNALSGKKVEEWRAIFNATPSHLKDKLGISEADLEGLRTFHSLVLGREYESESKFYDTLREEKKKMSVGTRMRFIAALDALQYDDFSQKEYKDGIFKDQSTDVARNLGTLRSNYIRGAKTYEFFKSDDIGICRDYAFTAVKAAEALGFKKPLVLSFPTRKGFHSVPMFQVADNEASLEDKRKVYFVNGGVVTSSSYGDSRTFSGVAENVGINVALSDHTGKTVKITSSEFGKFLQREAAGFDLNETNLGATSRASVIAAGARLDNQGTVNVRAGVGYDGSSAMSALGQGGDTGQIVFASLSNSYRAGTWSPGRGALVLGTRHTDNVVEGPLSNDFIYAQINQYLNTDSFKITPALQLRIENLFHGILMAARQRDGSDAGALVPQGDLRWKSSVHLDQTGSLISSNHAIGVQIVPGIKDVSNNTLKQMPIPVMNELFLSSEGRFRLSGSPRGLAYLAAATTVLYDQVVGPRFSSKVALVFKNIGGLVKVEGRMIDQSPVYTDGSARRVTAQFFLDPSRALKLSASGSVLLEKIGEQKSNDVQVMGSALLEY